MKVTLRTDLPMILEYLSLKDFPTTGALDPKAFGHLGSPLGNLGFNPGSL